jgi:hypothetical protein
MKIEGETLGGYKIAELFDLDDRGLVVQFSYPIHPKRVAEMAALNSMIDTAISAGSPYLLTKITENKYYRGRLVLWKENKALRCKQCNGFLGRRPKKFKTCLTHKHVGRKCEDVF